MWSERFSIPPIYPGLCGKGRQVLVAKSIILMTCTVFDTEVFARAFIMSVGRIHNLIVPKMGSISVQRIRKTQLIIIFESFQSKSIKVCNPIIIDHLIKTHSNVSSIIINFLHYIRNDEYKLPIPNLTHNIFFGEFNYIFC